MKRFFNWFTQWRASGTCVREGHSFGRGKVIAGKWLKVCRCCGEVKAVKRRAGK